MSEQKTFEEYVGNILSDYFESYNIKNPVIPNYQIVDDMADAYMKLRPDILSKTSSTADDLNRYNGFTVPPISPEETFTVLLNRNVFLENVKNRRWDWVGTIIHETTHVQDFCEYAKIISETDFDIITDINRNGMFTLWTEMNARSKGYFFVRKYTLGSVLTSKELIPDIINREIPLQWELLDKNYHSTQNGYQQAYLVAQYIGRLFTLQQLYPDTFTNKWVTNHFGCNEWMSNWFFFFQKYHVLVDASKHFIEMKDILRENFQGL